jgi:exopolyphosphatase/guanosine-5'-triphosphate,3'-diphosphate pyrophosphatase
MTKASPVLRRPHASHVTYANAPGVLPLSDRPEFRIAAIDVGSNSLHMAIAQADTDGSITTLWRMKEMVGLGRISFPSRNLSAEAMDRALTALARFQQAARVRGCEKVLAIATSAVREAQNGGDFLDRARQELGLRVKVVSARDEAKLIYLGVRHAVDLNAQPHFIVDVGGGSVEFIVGDKTRAALLESRKLGAARMTARYITSDPASPADLKALAAHYDRELGPICNQVLALQPVAAIGTSGTIENLAAMCAALYGRGDKGGSAEPGVLEREAVSKLVARLVESRSADRARIPGLDDQRKDQVIAGAVLVNELFRRLNLKEIRVCRSALREGILLEYLGRHLPELQVRRQVPDPRRRSVLDLARRCDWYQSHCEQVARLTLDLFDQLKPLHGLGTEERELIEYGALLHDIGWHIAREGHHRHGQYLILNGKLQNFMPEEVQVIAAFARYHRKARPRKRNAEFASLSKRARRVVKVGTALLRVADALDRTHCGVVTSVRCRIGKRSIDIHVKGRGDAELELWAARNNSGMMEDVFGRDVRFEYTS